MRIIVVLFLCIYNYSSLPHERMRAHAQRERERVIRTLFGRERWCSGNALHLCSRGYRFESRPKHRLSWLEFSWFSTTPSKETPENTGNGTRLVPSQTLFQFHYSSSHLSVLYSSASRKFVANIARWVGRAYVSCCLQLLTAQWCKQKNASWIGASFCWFLSRLTFKPWRWRPEVIPKHGAVSVLHGVTTQNSASLRSALAMAYNTQTLPIVRPRILNN
jgi:hypothetical protein